MIAAAGIKDQELPIAAKWAGVNYPAVAWRGDLCALMGGNRKPLLGSTGAVDRAKAANRHAVDRQMQLAARRRKGNRRRQTAGIAQGGKLRLRCVLLDRALQRARRTRCRIEVLLELGDQVLEIVDATRQIDRALLLAGQRLFGSGLGFLPGVDQHVEPQLLRRQPLQIAGKRAALGDRSE